MRRAFVLLHRYVGLSLAVFLILAGLTGSVIAFYKELDAMLNPGWFKVEPANERLSPSQWVERAESELTGVRVSYVQFPRQAQEAVSVWVVARKDKPVPDYDQVFLNPYTGEILGKRKWGAFRIDRAHLIPFIYKLHYTLHLGETGIFIIGIVSLIWFFDCFVGLYLGWPRWNWKGIKQALSVKWRAGAARVNFDLHRASGLWLWIVLAVLAFSGMAMNLHDEVFQPIVRIFSKLSPRPEASLLQRANPEAPFSVSIEQAAAAAEAYLGTKGTIGEVGAIGIDHAKGSYRVRFYSDTNIMKDHPETQIFISAETAAVLGKSIPREGTAGDIVSQWQYPLHSGKAFGLPGRILICLSGIVTALLSVTGVVIWWRKFRRRNGGIDASANSSLPTERPKELT